MTIWIEPRDSAPADGKDVLLYWGQRVPMAVGLQRESVER
jgi:hypothetical protein